MTERRTYAGIVSISALATVLCFCAPGCRHAHPSHGKAAWSYEGTTGPAHWGDLSPAYSLCKSGRCQSPVDLVATATAAAPAMQFAYQATPLAVINNGHSIQQNCRDGGYLEVKGKRYALKQFHFHSLSEHTVKGAHYAMELHLVHQSQDGELAVVGVFLDKGKENALLARFWNRLPGKHKPLQDNKTEVNILDCLPQDKACYAYDGSLTTPPGSEGVKWYVLSSPVTVSADQLATFRSLYSNNYRPVQPLNGRIITHLKPKSP